MTSFPRLIISSKKKKKSSKSLPENLFYFVDLLVLNENDEKMFVLHHDQQNLFQFYNSIILK